MSHKNGKRYNEDFRKTVVDLCHSGQSVKMLSSEYGVSEVTIYKWIKTYSPIETSNGEKIDYSKGC